MKIGLGTAAIGRPQYINIKPSPTTSFELEAFRQAGLHTLDEAYAAGIRYFDTAPGYGMAEQLLIDWLERQEDLEIEIATKWGYEYVANFDPNAEIHELKNHSLAQLEKQWKSSKALSPRLTTLQIHSATFDTGVLDDESVLQRLAELKVEHQLVIGLSCTGDNQVDVLKYALDIQVEDQQLFDVYQVTYNILDQSLASIISELEDKRVVIKEGLANGRLFRNENYSNYHRLYDRLEQMAEQYDVGIDAVALRFCLDTVDPFMVLSGAANAKQLRENLKANTFQLTQDEIAELKVFSQSPKAYWAERKQLSWQ
ncbi:aldo/keto reductase [Reichenbachiella carrageenanivorans]|uniref:Aldo/keto reductase n=1 Tax=Reichenbachiella carrageenanivorans TaxID=2979869 RepID=A0ABY6CX01_9BACT|nr:aldo/keto reductase [Reichenbachiella carrageenanivorans]UXX78442.1 aldo/keto reductase [Reichenbachiella carrageenanivorans]